MTRAPENGRRWPSLADIRGVRWLLVLCFVLVSASLPAFAQSAALQTSHEGPYYVDVPVTLQIQTRGFEHPEISAPEQRNARFVASGSRSTQMYTANGRTTITLGIQCYFTASKPGKYRIGPLTVSEGGESTRTNSIEIVVREVEIADDMKLKVNLPQKPVYVGQKATAMVEWWVKDSSSSAYLSRDSKRTFSIPIFLRSSGFRFVDAELSRGDQALSFDTHDGSATVKVQVREQVVEGENWIVIEGSRIFIPTKTGQYEFEPATVTARKVTGRRRGFFDSAPTKLLKAVDLPRTLEVVNVPARGRPPSYAGAIGGGYSLDVSADRTVVQTNDPITLTLTLRGDGIDRAGFPNLAKAGLGRQFRASRAAGGILQDDGSKVFTATIRAVDENLDAIPAIRYSWFDVETDTYKTTESRPIALSVRRGQVVTAADAVGNAKSDADTGDSTQSVAPQSASLTSGQPTFTLTGADLSLSDPEKALGHRSSPLGGRPVRWGLYLSPFALIALAWFGRMRAAIDPEVAARRKRLVGARNLIETARSLPSGQAVEQVAGALRSMIAEVPHSRSKELEDFLAGLEVLIYAPEGSGAAIDDQLLQRARELAKQIEGKAN